MTAPEPSPLLGVDVGTVRIGIAMSGRGSRLAMPVETVARGDGDVERIVELARRIEVERIYVGDPLTLSGAVGPAADAARGFAARLADAMPAVEVRLVDERLTTAAAQRRMREAGRNTRKSRAVVDQAAAVAILQNALDSEIAAGAAAGTAVRREGHQE